MFGNFIWKFRSEILFGNFVGIFRYNILFGYFVWKFRLEIFVWKFSFGNFVWKTDRQTDQPTEQLVEAPSQSLKMILEINKDIESP